MNRSSLLDRSDYCAAQDGYSFSMNGRLIPEETVEDLKRVYISQRFYCTVKRFFDLLISLVGAIVLIIPFALISLSIVLDDPGPVLFSQYRIGRKGKEFVLYKFRTMKTNAPKYVPTSEINDPYQYITRVGRFLRKYSLDELPQVFNIIRGDMSIVGPRPLIPAEREIHSMRTRFGVYSVRPGITGLAQIHGRDLVSPADKVRWDVKYLQNFGLRQDLCIFLMTIPKVFCREGVVEGKLSLKCMSSRKKSQ